MLIVNAEVMLDSRKGPLAPWVVEFAADEQVADVPVQEDRKELEQVYREDAESYRVSIARDFSVVLFDNLKVIQHEQIESVDVGPDSTDVWLIFQVPSVCGEGRPPVAATLIHVDGVHVRAQLFQPPSRRLKGCRISLHRKLWKGAGPRKPPLSLLLPWASHFSDLHRLLLAGIFR